MTNYRAFKSVAVTSAESPYNMKTNAPKHWGILLGKNASGSITLEGGGTILMVDIDDHNVFPCYGQTLSVSSGTVYVLQ
jgi:hypothetical protein